MNFNWNETEVLITGGTGSLGTTIIKLLQNEKHPKGIRVFSRDEFKQWQLKNELDALGIGGNVAFLIGDVRDKERLRRAMKGVDVIFNTAAMKQVPSCEYNPEEPIKTNIIGAMNILDCAIDEKVKVCMHVSTDKAVYPVNIYGATKLVAEKLFLHGNVYSAGRTKFSCCRYGNVLGSRGSIIPLFKDQAKTGVVTITHTEMTRFWIKLQDVARFIIEAAQNTVGAEIFVPQMPSMNIMDLAKVIAPDAEKKVTGIRQGEKLHECLITEEESVYTEVSPSKFIIRPLADPITSERFSYTSENNKTFLNETDLKKLIDGGLYI